MGVRPSGEPLADGAHPIGIAGIDRVMQLQEHHAGLLVGGWTVAHPVLATAVGRLRWAASHLLFGLLGPAVALAAAGLAEGLAYGLVSGDVEGELPLGWPGRRWGCPRSGCWPASPRRCSACCPG
jgi:hypothetical protein